MNKLSLVVVVMVGLIISPLFSMEQNQIQQYGIDATKKKYLALRQSRDAKPEDIVKIVAMIFFRRSPINWFFENDCFLPSKADKSKE